MVNGTLSTVEDQFPRCPNHRHSAAEGPHVAQELPDGGYSFPDGDCRLIGNDGKVIYINRIHAAAMSQFLHTALVSTNFTEHAARTVSLPLFTSTEILDALEMSNWIIQFWLEHNKIPKLKQISISCAFGILRVATFFVLEYLIQAISLLIENNVTPDRLIEAYRLAQITNAALAERLWQKILSDFVSIYENNTFVHLTPVELEKCFADKKLNIRVPNDIVVLQRYRATYVPGDTNLDHLIRKQKIDAIFGITTGYIGAVEQSRDLLRIPHEVIIAQAGWGENGPTSKMEVYDYHRNQWISSPIPTLEEESRAYHGVATIDKGILCMGGFNGRTYFRSTSFYDFETMSWNRVCAMVEPRCYVSLAKIDDSKLLACGGFTGQSRLRTTEIYNYDRNQWYKAGTMNSVRSDSRAITLPEQNRVYMIGGFDGRQCHSTLEYYCADRDEWINETALMTSCRSGVGAVAINNNVIFAFGGYDGTHQLLTSEAYDIREGLWHQLSNMNSSRSNFGNACLEGEPWVIGGYNADRTIAECERY
uniref:Uncharacterized protein n=1 Tax=Panagrolaimus sp. PS1159 TaxID=55785 RepID=A0AC35EQ23_9BILA